jgi:hypothetical protein
MQNARRAKASYVAVDYDGQAQRSRCATTASAFPDWQALFTVGESGWDAVTARDERFGMGFMKSSYSARRCSVRSRGKRIAFDTAEALRRVRSKCRLTRPQWRPS